jgi:hypothetical protein
MRSLRVQLPAVALFVLCALVTVAIAGPSEVVGSGTVASQVRGVHAFRAIRLHGPVDLQFRVGPQRVEIVADDNILPLVTTTVKDGTLVLDLTKQRMTTRNPIKAIITAPTLEAVAIHGSGDADLSGLASASFAVSIDGSGDVCARGKAGRVAVSIRGSGDVDTRALRADTAAVQVSGSGDVEVFAVKSVAATVNGSGAITVHGKPASVARQVNGSGSIRVL